MMINDFFQKTILSKTGATALYEKEVIQSLWSGYGAIIRYGLKGSTRQSVVVKHISLSENGSHPRGWNTNLSHQRKVKSYQVEKTWYQQWNHYCGKSCRVPECLAVEFLENEVLIVLEDLDESGFSVRKQSVSETEMNICLSWLANFHATYMDKTPQGLWQFGTYWHLDTRPDELEVLKDQKLKKAAVLIDQALKNSHFQTIVHGDAKLANFCFSSDGKRVAAVDFQYVGGGCGIKDVAYFIGSCLDEDECEYREAQLLDVYFQALGQALHSKKAGINFKAVEEDWRALYPVAWTDFYRFLKGWSPGHWKINAYSERLADEVLARLEHKVEN